MQLFAFAWIVALFCLGAEAQVGGFQQGFQQPSNEASDGLAVDSPMAASQLVQVSQGQQANYAQQSRSLNAVANDALGRVVTLLNDLKVRIEAEGREEKVLFDAFMCWCQVGFKEKEEAIQASRDVILTLHPRIQEGKTQIALLEKNLETTNAELADDQQALKTALELRAKERASFQAESQNMEESLASLTKAMQVLGNVGFSMVQLQQVVQLVQGALLPFAQTEGLVKQCLQDEHLQEFLSVGKNPGYATAFLQGEQGGPSGALGQVVGMLRQMHENFRQDLAEIKATEEQAQASHDNLVRTKTEEISSAVAQVQSMSEEKSQLEIQLNRDEHDLIDTQKSLAEDEKFFRDMKEQCNTKTQEWTERSNMRLLEMTGINEAVDILQEDDEVVSFHRVMKAQGGGDLPTHAPSLLQVGEGFNTQEQTVSTQDPLIGSDPQEQGLQPMPIAFVQLKASTAGQGMFLSPKPAGGQNLDQLMSVIQTHLQADPSNKQLGFLAVKVKSMMDGGATQSDFKALIAMVKQTIEIMVMEQKEDNTHKTWCETEITKNTADLKDQEEQKTALTQEIDNLDSQLKEVNEEITQLRDDIAEIVKQRDQSTKTRLEEQHNYDGEMVELREAEQALYRAIQVLQAVYGSTPALVQAAKRRSSMSVAPPPSTWAGDYKGAEGGKNILQMLAEIGEDLVRQQADSEKNEKQAKADYEQNMMDYESDTRLKQERLVSQSSLKAKMELNKENDESDLDQVEETLDSLNKQKLELHTSCDFILKNHEERERLRSADIANMKAAINILAAER